jgi:hypothetical protein
VIFIITAIHRILNRNLPDRATLSGNKNRRNCYKSSTDLFKALMRRI